MRYITVLSFIAGALALPAPQTAGAPPAGAAPGGFDLGALLGGAGGAPGGFDIGALLGGLGNLGASPGSNTDINTIVTGYKDVESKLSILDTAVKALGDSTTAATAQDLLTKSQAVTAALKSATTKITGAKAITDLFASAELTTPGDSVSALLETTINDLIEKKAILMKAGQGAAILKELKDQKDATTAFTGAINIKLPAIAQIVASGTSQRPIVALDNGITAFT